MAGATECWVTTGLNEEQCVNALVLAKSLKRVMTLRKLVILVSSSVRGELWDILQDEFDVCIRLDEKRAQSSGTTAEMYAKIYCWSLVKWEKVVFLEPHCLVVQNCDELFKVNGFASDSSLFAVTPSLETWITLLKIATGGNMDYEKLIENARETEVLDVKLHQYVDLHHGSLVKNLDEFTIVSFNGTHPIEIICRNSKHLVTGYFENALMELWQSDWERGVIQSLSKLQNPYTLSKNEELFKP